jgi:hypothetical protein
MTEMEIKTGMTNEEAEYLDDYYTKHTITPGPNLLKLGIKPGFARKALKLMELEPRRAPASGSYTFGVGVKGG